MFPGVYELCESRLCAASPSESVLCGREDAMALPAVGDLVYDDAHPCLADDLDEHKGADAV